MAGKRGSRAQEILQALARMLEASQGRTYHHRGTGGGSRRFRSGPVSALSRARRACMKA